MAKAKIKRDYAGALSIQESVDFVGVLANFAQQVKDGIVQDGLNHVGNLVIAEAQKRVPRSSQTGTKKRWSRSYRERYKKSTPLHTQFIIKHQKYRTGKVLAVIVKVRYPQGAHGHLVEFGHRSVLWGRRTGGMVQGKRFMLPAIEAVRSRADSEFRRAVEYSITKAGG